MQQQYNMKTISRRGCRGRKSKRRHRDVWLKRIGAAWALAHQDGAAVDAVQDIEKKTVRYGGTEHHCGVPVQKSTRDVHTKSADACGEEPQSRADNEIGASISAGRSIAHLDGVAESGPGPQEAACVAANAKIGIELAHRDGAAGGLCDGHNEHFVEVASMITAVQDAVSQVVTRMKHLEHFEVTSDDFEKTTKGDGAARRVDAAHQEEEKTTGAAHQIDDAHQEEKKNICNNCGEEFRSRSQLFKHLRAVHPDTLPEECSVAMTKAAEERKKRREMKASARVQRHACWETAAVAATCAEQRASVMHGEQELSDEGQKELVEECIKWAVAPPVVLVGVLFSYVIGGLGTALAVWTFVVSLAGIAQSWTSDTSRMQKLMDIFELGFMWSGWMFAACVMGILMQWCYQLIPWTR